MHKTDIIERKIRASKNTTVRIKESLFLAAQSYALDAHKNVSCVVNRAVEFYLITVAKEAKKYHPDNFNRKSIIPDPLSPQKEIL